MQLSMAYGRGMQTAEVADERVIEEIKLPSRDGIQDLAAALDQSLANPIGPGLADVIQAGDHVALMTVDFTRPNPSFMLGELGKRIEDLGATYQIIIGLGTTGP